MQNEYTVPIILGSYIILCLIIHGIYLWLIRKCVRVYVCHKKTCKFHKFCPKYEAGLTQEDKEALYRLLDEYKIKDQ